MNVIKKTVLALVFSLICSNGFSQLTLVPGQPENSSLDQNASVLIDDELSFLYYYLYEGSDFMGKHLYSFKNNTIEEVDFDLGQWADIRYIGNLNDSYYFVNDSAGDGFLHEYNRVTNQTASRSLPENGYSMINSVATMDGKLHFMAKPINTNEWNIISYDGNAFEVSSYPAPTGYVYWRNYYASSQNLIYLHYIYPSQGKSKVYTYDGNMFNEITLTQNTEFAVILDEFNSKTIMSLGEGNPYGGKLYESDGNTINPINPGVDKVLDFYAPKNKEGKRYYNFTDTATGTKSYFYEYNGSNLALIASYPDYNYMEFLTEYDGKDYFNLLRNDISKHMLYSYDGTNLTLIEGESGDMPLTFGGILDNKLYIMYPKSDGLNVLASYNSGETEVVEIGNTPEYSIMFHRYSLNNTLVYGYQISEIPDDEYKYYAMTSSNEFIELDASGYYNQGLEFLKGDNLYFSFYRDNTFRAKLFSWDGVLSIPELNSSLNEISLFPVPVKEKLTVKLPNSQQSRETTLSIYTMEGKRIESFKTNDQETKIDMSHLENGIYIVEISNDSGSTFKKIIKN